MIKLLKYTSSFAPFDIKFNECGRNGCPLGFAFGPGCAALRFASVAQSATPGLRPVCFPSLAGPRVEEIIRVLFLGC
jgi:hypothetical protein